MKQFRPPVGYTIELPAGLIDPGEEPLWWTPPQMHPWVHSRVKAPPDAPRHIQGPTARIERIAARCIDEFAASLCRQVSRRMWRRCGSSLRRLATPPRSGPPARLQHRTLHARGRHSSERTCLITCRLACWVGSILLTHLLEPCALTCGGSQVLRISPPVCMSPGLTKELIQIVHVEVDMTASCNQHPVQTLGDDENIEARLARLPYHRCCALSSLFRRPRSAEHRSTHVRLRHDPPTI